jgi:DNA-binding transcriptional regulator GbsR (MarR family)
MRLVEAGGRTSQELGLGRMVGQVLVYLYLAEGERSMDEIEAELGLSKAAVSVTARQLEGLGLVTRVWRKGDRRNYYRTADNLASALQAGLLGLLRRKLDSTGSELDRVHELLQAAGRANGADREIDFLKGRVKRAKVLRDRAANILGSRLFQLLVR